METNKVARREPNNTTGGVCAPGSSHTDALGWWLKDSSVSLTAWMPPVVLCRLLQGTLLPFMLVFDHPGMRFNNQLSFSRLDREGTPRHGTLLTKLSSSGSSLKKGLCSRSCWCTKFSMSTSKLADVMHSDPCVACSHFSNNNASRGNSGCLRTHRERERRAVCVSWLPFIYIIDCVKSGL